jgi:hypothetical protein
VYGVIAHEICHFVMFKIFKNMAKPYKNADSVIQEKFQRISNNCQFLKDADRIVSLVFDCYDEDQHHAELIVRIPHMLGHYCNDPEKTQEVKQMFSELYRFYVNECVPKMEQELKKIADKEMINTVKKFFYVNLFLYQLIDWMAVVLGFLALLCVFAILLCSTLPGSFRDGEYF